MSIVKCGLKILMCLKMLSNKDAFVNLLPKQKIRVDVFLFVV